MSQLPPTSKERDTPRGVQTNGIGKFCDGHLNLTRTLADVQRDDVEFIVRWREAHRDPAEFQNGKLPFSGK